MSPEPLPSGDSETQREPAFDMLSERMARILPLASSASSAFTARSRP